MLAARRTLPRWYLGCIPAVTSSNMSIHRIAIPPHCRHSSRLESDTVKKHKKDLHMRHGVQRDILEIDEFGKSYTEDEVNKEDEALEDIFVHNLGSAKSLEDPWGEAMASIIQAEKLVEQPKLSEEDLMLVRAARPTQTLAALVQESSTLKRLVDLGVPLHLWDSNNQLGLAVKLDFDRDVAPVVRFLADVGVDPHMIGDILGGNPGLMEEELEDLHTRVNYLVSKLFTRQEIAQLICGSPKWLSFPVAIIDARLGFFQKTFGLEGQEVRDLAVGRPSLITWKGTPAKVKKHIFSLDEEMGFSREELRKMVVAHPSLLKRDDNLVLRCFEVLHCEAGIPHHVLAHFPTALTGNPLEVTERHQFLTSLGRAQYDPGKPQYVSLTALAEGSDLEFAEKVARSTIQLYNAFLKTL